MPQRNYSQIGLDAKQIAAEANREEIEYEKYLEHLCKVTRCHDCVYCDLPPNGFPDVGYCKDQEIFLSKDDLMHSIWNNCGAIEQI